MLVKFIVQSVADNEAFEVNSSFIILINAFFIPYSFSANWNSIFVTSR